VTDAAHAPIDPDTYVQMRDCIMRVAWCLDRGDSDGVRQCFTPDGVVTTADGTRFEGASGVHRFAAQAARNPAFRGRQHHVTPLFAEQSASGPIWTSYYQLLRFDAAARAPEILSLGYYRDVFAVHEGQVLIASRMLLRWNAELAPGPATSPAPARIAGPTKVAGDGPPFEDRNGMEALMHEYAVALDSGDLLRMTAVFAPGGVLNSGGLGRLEAPLGLQRFLATNTRNPSFGGRQHRIFPMIYEQRETGWRAFSYWKVETWAAGALPEVVAIGYYEDEFVRHRGRWLIGTKTIRRWNSETAPMVTSWPEPA
jgi:hypothetical protein